MSYIEDEYKKRFEDQEINNDDLNSEDLWNNISDKIGPDQPDRDRRFIPLIFLLFLAGMGLIGSVFWTINADGIAANLNTNMVSTAPIESDEKEKEIQIKDIQSNKAAIVETVVQNNLDLKSNDGIEGKSFKNNSVTASTTVITKKSIERIVKINSEKPPVEKSGQNNLVEAFNTNNTIVNAQKETESAFFSSVNIKSEFKTKAPKISIEQKIEQPPIEQTNLTIDKNVDQEKTVQLNLSQQTNYKTIITPRLKTISASNIESTKIISDTLKSNLLDFGIDHMLTTKLINPSNPSTFNIGIFGGINTFNSVYSTSTYNDLVNLKGQTEKGIIGTSFGVNVAYLWKDNWIVQSGIEYHQLNSKFEYEQKKDIDYPLTNQLIKVWIDESTNDTLSRQYGNAMVNAVETKYVLHHNQVKRFTIPLEIGGQIQKDKMTYGLTLGVNFNFITAQSGRMLNKNQEIINFNNNTPANLLNDFHMGYRLSPFIGYQLSDKFRLNIQPRLTFLSKSDFDDSDIKIAHQQFELNLGAVYQW